MSIPKVKLLSFLAPWMRQYLAFRADLGYSVTARDFYLFRDLDYYVLWKGLSRMEQLDECFVANWVFVMPSHSTGTKNTRLTFLRCFCRYLVRLGLLKDNPAQRVRRLRQRKFRPYIYTVHELASLLKEADKWKQQCPAVSFAPWVMETLVHLIYACGLRISEALNLKIKDIDFTESTLSLWKTKFHKERLVPFSLEIRNRLQTYLAERATRFPDLCSPGDFVFCHRRGKYAYENIHHMFRHNLLLPSGLIRPRGPRIHDLRHTFAVHRLYKWYQEGCDVMNKLPLLSTYMGHVGIESTQVYLTIALSLLREGSRRFKEHSENLPRALLRRVLGKDGTR